jgi:hypothetical protein
MIGVQGRQGKMCETLSQPIARCGDVYMSSQVIWEAEIGRIIVPGQPGQKKNKKQDPNGKKLGMVGRCLVGSMK